MEAKESLAEKLLDESHIKQANQDMISQDLLKKYIIYARRFVHPKLNDID